VDHREVDYRRSQSDADGHVRDESADVEGEDDGAGEADAQSAFAARGRQGERIDWKPNRINIDTIRNYYPRAGGRFGTRIMMKAGAAYIVLNTFDEVTALIDAA
jgi:hypothetical protein